MAKNKAKDAVEVYDHDDDSYREPKTGVSTPAVGRLLQNRPNAPAFHLESIVQVVGHLMRNKSGLEPDGRPACGAIKSAAGDVHVPYVTPEVRDWAYAEVKRRSPAADHSEIVEGAIWP